jgi:Xaa-Pro aminopeptidase
MLIKRTMPSGTESFMSNAASPLSLLRAELKKSKLSGYIVPRQDEFQGEYVAAYAERLKWLTSFAGSWGLAIVTLNKAAIFVDGRYTIQVREQVDTKIFTPQHLVDEPPTKWIETNLKKDDRLGFDPWLTTAGEAKRLAAACARVGAKLVPVTKNLVDLDSSAVKAYKCNKGPAPAICRAQCRR